MTRLKKKTLVMMGTRMVKPKNVIIAVIILSVCFGAFLILLTNSSVPTFTVKELMDHRRPDSFLNRKIQLVGVVREVNSTGFNMTDSEDLNNASLIIYINTTSTDRPAGVEPGKKVLVEGKLISTTNVWKLKATLISTVCPSKYEQEEPNLLYF